MKKCNRFYPFKEMGFTRLGETWDVVDHPYVAGEGPWRKTGRNKSAMLRWLEKNIPQAGDACEGVKNWGPAFLGLEKE